GGGRIRGVGGRNREAGSWSPRGRRGLSTRFRPARAGPFGCAWSGLIVAVVPLAEVRAVALGGLSGGYEGSSVVGSLPGFGKFGAHANTLSSYVPLSQIHRFDQYHQLALWDGVVRTRRSWQKCTEAGCNSRSRRREAW